VKAKTHVDFLISRASHWPVCRELIYAFFNDAGCAARVVPLPSTMEAGDRYGDQLRSQIEEDGLTAVDFREYDIEREMPDMAIVNQPYDYEKISDFRFLRIHNLVGYTVYLEYALKPGISTSYAGTALTEAMTRSWLRIFPSSIHAEAYKFVYRMDGASVCYGFPEADAVARAMKGRKKQKRPLVILWNLNAASNAREGTALERRIEMIQKMLECYPEITTMLRAHPRFGDFPFSRPFADRLRLLEKKYGNCVRDTESSIHLSYAKSDAFITEPGSSTIMSGLASGLPLFIFAAVFPVTNLATDMYLLSAMYNGSRLSDLDAFYRMIRNQSDPKHSFRKNIAETYLGAPDGNASLRIQSEIMERYHRSEAMLWND
jgi:hypothetical protein